MSQDDINNAISDMGYDVIDPELESLMRAKLNKERDMLLGNGEDLEVRFKKLRGCIQNDTFGGSDEAVNSIVHGINEDVTDLISDLKAYRAQLSKHFQKVKMTS